jgi:hypothetical protein
MAALSSPLASSASYGASTCVMFEVIAVMIIVNYRNLR